MDCLAVGQKVVECLAVYRMSGRVPESNGLSCSRTESSGMYGSGPERTGMSGSGP